MHPGKKVFAQKFMLTLGLFGMAEIGSREAESLII